MPVLQILILGALLAVWQFSVSDEKVMFFSRPSLIVARLFELFSSGEIFRDIYVTLAEVLLGYVAGGAIALALGYALGRSAFLSSLLQPFIIGMYSIPKIALAPVFIVWLGLGMSSKVAVVAIATFFLVFFSTYSGLKHINEEFVRLAQLMGATRLQVIGRVILPAAAAEIFLGLKTAVPYAVIGAVIGEYIGANEGLGHFVLYASQTYDAAGLFAGIAILVAIVFAVNFALGLIESRLIRWRSSSGPQVQI